MEMMTTYTDCQCGSCGQQIIPDWRGRTVCDACWDRMYGKDEKHEKARLFAPAPAQLAGQLGMEMDS